MEVCRGSKIGVRSVRRALERPSARQVAHRKETVALRGPGGVKIGGFWRCLGVCRGPKIGVGSVWRALVRMSARQVAQRRETEAPKGPKVEA